MLPVGDIRRSSMKIMGRRHAAKWTLALAIGFGFGSAGPLQAQSIFSKPVVRQQPEGLSLTSGATGFTREKTGTAFFVDDSGHMLTAGHAAADCARIIVAKEGRVVAGRVIAVSTQSDLALILVPKTLGLSAVFPRSVTVGSNEMVFAAAYGNLAGMMAHGGTLANATVSSGAAAGTIAIDSDVTFGASGAPVLDSRGLVQGIISRRTGSDRVLAADAVTAKAFLAANHVTVQEDDRPQIAGTASRANRAASISARVSCLQN
jgi:S1-C subfamily serine protease